MAKIRPIWTVLLCIITASLTTTLMAGTTNQRSEDRIKISVDHRVELMCVIARFAGYEEYNTDNFPSYMQAVDDHFGPYRDHDVISFAQKIRPGGVGFEKVMQIAIAVKDVESMEEIVPLDSPNSPLARNWKVDEAREFLRLARQFAKESDFAGFVSGHQDMYGKSQERMNAMLTRSNVIGWLTDYFGAGTGCDYRIVIAPQIGPNNYGASLSPQNDGGTIYSFIGVGSVDDEGVPEFHSYIEQTILHEMAHSFVNPLVEENVAELTEAGEKIYPHVAEMMERSSYGHWKIVFWESLVRATGVRREQWLWSAREAAIQQDTEEEKGFYWIGGLSTLMAEYEADRSKYPDFRSFFPKIVSFFVDYGRNAGEKIQKLKDDKRLAHEKLREISPKIVSISPPIGATDVDPATDRITVVFDRPMQSGYSVMTRGRGMGEAPGKAGNCYWDSTMTVFTWPVKVEPDTEYGFSLNGKWNLSFTDTDGNPLVPTLVNFRTRKD